jgi:hypothetical protein
VPLIHRLAVCFVFVANRTTNLSICMCTDWRYIKRQNFRIELSNLYKIILFFLFFGKSIHCFSSFISTSRVIFFCIQNCILHTNSFVSLSLSLFLVCLPIQCVRTCVWQAVRRLKNKKSQFGQINIKKDFYLHFSLR